MTQLEIDNLRESFYSSPIFKYYDEKGHAKAAAFANQIEFAKTKEGKRLASLGGIKSKLNRTREKKSEIKITKEKILKIHSQSQTWTEALERLNIGWQLYNRLCKTYEIKPLKWDKTTKNSGPSKSILVYKLIETPCEIYSSTKELSRKILGSQHGHGVRLHNEEINYDKKIKFTEDITGRKCRFKLTGNQTQIGNRTPSNEIQVYELIEELIPYSTIQPEFPSLEEVRRVLGIDVAIQSQLNGKIYQSKGYRFKKIN